MTNSKEDKIIQFNKHCLKVHPGQINGTGGGGGERGRRGDKSQSRLGPAPFKEKLSEIRYFLRDLFHLSPS